MQTRKILLAALLLLALAAPAWSADTYAIDPVHTWIGFSVRHLVITNVQGRFKDFSGSIVYDPDDITKSSVSVTIQAASLDTESENRDNHLRSADFFDVVNQPTLTFTSNRIERRGESYVCVGTLTIRGVAREVAIPFEILGTVKDPRGNTRLGLEGSLTVNRQDYGVSWSRALEGGGLVVGNEVKITLNVEAVKRALESTPAPAPK